MSCTSITRMFAAAALLMVCAPLRAELSAEELAKLAQNPIANLISVPFQENVNFNYGPLKKNQNVFNIEPVIPFELNKDWNVITRTIIPVISQPALFPGDNRTNGIGETQFSAFLSPANPVNGLVWGVGAITQLPTTSDSALGSYRWGLGPTVVVLHTDKGDPWVYGFLANNVWSVGNGAGGSYNNFLLQPFIHYNLEGGLYLTTAPILTANWKASSGQKWTVPVGGGVGKIFHLGRLPVNTELEVYYNAVRPDFGANWQIQLQATLMFPK